jgi:hypothetical protein
MRIISVRRARNGTATIGFLQRWGVVEPVAGPAYNSLIPETDTDPAGGLNQLMIRIDES